MSLKDVLADDLKSAMKDKDIVRKNTVQMVRAGVLQIEKDKKVTLTWEAVDPGVLADPTHGTFGYNIYKDNILIDWTSKLTYTFTPTGSAYGTYKVVATYKAFDGIKSDAAIKEFNKESQKPSSSPSTKPTTSPSTEPTQPDKPITQ